jgi:hypothetical protein
VWVVWGARLTAILALLAILGGLVVLALPETMEGREILPLDKTHSLHLADLVGAGMVGAGAFATWIAVLTWHRKRIQQ